MSLEAKKLDVVSVKDIKDFVANADALSITQKKPEAENEVATPDDTATIEHKGKHISLDSAAGVLLSAGKTRSYSRSSQERQKFLESQMDMFAMTDEELDTSFENAKEDLIEKRDNPFGVFNSISSEKTEDALTLTFHDDDKTFGTDAFSVSLPLVDDKKTLVAVTVDDVRPQSEISDENFENAIKEVSTAIAHTVNAIKAEGKPTYNVYAAPEFEFTQFFDEVEEEYGEKSFRYAESDVEAGKPYVSFRFADKLMKDVDARYANQKDSEFPDNSMPKYGVKLIASDVSYNGVSDQNPTVIVRQPWMMDNTFNASMHANLIDVIEDKMEVAELHTKQERSGIAKPVRPLTEELEKKESMGLSL